MKNEMTRRSDYDFFDEAMHDMFPAFYGGKHSQKYMRTDIKENEDSYLMEVEIPGADKNDIHVDLKDGYLNISVSRSEKSDGGKKDNYIHRERSFSCSRSYYVGDIRKEDIKAKYENGILNVVIPKEVREKAENRLLFQHYRSMMKESRGTGRFLYGFLNSPA